MADRSGFDPRYDPAFQRGYPGATGTTSGGRGDQPTSPRPESKPNVRSAPAAFDPPRIEPAHLSRPRTDDARRPDATTSPHPADADDAGAGDPALAPRDPRRNPFLIAVAALGVACLVVGGFWLDRTREFFDVGARNDGDFWLIMVSLFAAPLLLSLGVAILAGVLFFLARHWQQRAG